MPQAGRRRAARTGHVVLQLPGMAAGVAHQLPGTQNRLRGQPIRQVARHAHVDGAVGERLDQDEHVGRSAAAQRRHGVQLRLGDLLAGADRAQQLRREGGVPVIGAGAAHEHRTALAHQSRRVRHGADHATGGGQNL